jgi:hypothetical protein
MTCCTDCKHRMAATLCTQTRGLFQVHHCKQQITNSNKQRRTARLLSLSLSVLNQQTRKYQHGSGRQNTPVSPPATPILPTSSPHLTTPHLSCSHDCTAVRGAAGRCCVGVRLAIAIGVVSTHTGRQAGRHVGGTDLVSGWLLAAGVGDEISFQKPTSDRAPMFPTKTKSNLFKVSVIGTTNCISRVTSKIQDITRARAPCCQLSGPIRPVSRGKLLRRFGVPSTSRDLLTAQLHTY